jgi:hypothetical protein
MQRPFCSLSAIGETARVLGKGLTGRRSLNPAENIAGPIDCDKHADALRGLYPLSPNALE